MAKTPVIWDETVGLGGDPWSHAAVARKAKDGSWYVAAIGDARAHDVEIDMSFLGCGEWTAETFCDDEVSADEPEHFVHRTFDVKAGGKRQFRLAPGGGLVMRLTAK